MALEIASRVLADMSGLLPQVGPSDPEMGRGDGSRVLGQHHQALSARGTQILSMEGMADWGVV